MTRKEFRKSRLFIELNKKVDELIKPLNISLIFGFPNQSSKPVLVKYANWKIINTTKVFEIPIQTIPLASIASKIKLKKLYDSFLHERITNQKSSIFIQKKDWNGMFRNQEFYNYKSYSNNYTLEFEYGRVWLKVKGSIFIGDLLLNNRNNFKALMKELKSFAKKIGARKIIFITSPNTAICKIFEKHYQAKDGNAIGMKIYQKGFKIDLQKLQFTLGDYDTF